MRICAVIPALLLATLPPFAFCQKALPANQAASNSMSEMPQILVAPLFIESAGFTSTISMVSELNFPVTAQVVLFDRHGTRITSQTVQFQAHSAETVRVGDLLRSANSAETMGSVEVLPDPAKVVTMAIAAQLSIDGSRASFGKHIEEEFLMMGMTGSRVLRASGGSLVSNPVLALRNTAATAQSATVLCITEKGAASVQTVQLAAGGWAAIHACSKSRGPVSSLDETLVAGAQTGADSGAFGVSVTGSGPPGSLAAFAFSWRGAADQGAMLSSQNFVDAGAFRSGNLVFTGIPVGVADTLPGTWFTPRVALANFGPKPAKAMVRFARTGGSGPVEASTVATVTLPAMSAQTIELPPLTGDPALRNSFIVDSDAGPGALMASVVAVGAPGFGLVEQIGKDQETIYNGGGHPWDLTDGQDAVLLLFNHSAAPKYFNVKIGNGGVLWQQPYLLAAMETRAIRIRDLIAGQVKDQHGEVLPRNLERGEIGWFTANPAEGAGRLMQINPVSQTVAADTRVARNFSCSYAFVLCGASVAPASTTFYDGQVSSQLEAVPAVCLSVTPTICSGQASSYGGLGYMYQWTASGPAQVYGPSTLSIASFLGTGAGSGWAYVSIRAEDNGHHYYCQESGFGNLSVAPKINGVQPLSAPPGQTVTLTGLGFGSSPGVKFGGTSVSPTSSSDTQIKCIIPVSASGGNTQVTVTSGGETSNAVTVYVQIPTYIKVVNRVLSSNLGCEAGQLGYGTDVTYQVLDQGQGNIAVAGYMPQEHLPPWPSGQFEPFATPQTTNGSGQFLDTPVGTCFGPPAPSTNVCINTSQTFNILGAPPTQYSIQTVTTRTDCVLGQKLSTSSPAYSVTSGSVP